MMLGDGPAVVVDEHDHTGAELGKIVQALKRQSARERPVANHGDHVIALPRQIARLCHAAGKAHRGGGVTHGKEVVFGFVGAGKTG